MSFHFEKLEVWQKAIEFADLVYKITRHFPEDERFGLANQMRRASVSVSSNVAEGSSRLSPLDFARFLEIAAGSVYEVASQSSVALRQGYISPDDQRRVYAAAEEQSKMLSGLRKHLKRKASGQTELKAVK